MVYLISKVPSVDHPHYIFDPNNRYIKGCYSINEPFSIDPFLNWERSSHSLQTTASDSLEYQTTEFTIFNENSILYKRLYMPNALNKKNVSANNQFYNRLFSLLGHISSDI